MPMLPARLLCCLGSALALLPLAAAPAAAQTAASDAKCFLVSNMFSKSSDARAKKAAVEASFFYLGRLNGSGAQLEALLTQQAKTINSKNASATMQSCARTVAQRASAIQAVGKRLSEANPN